MKDLKSLSFPGRRDDEEVILLLRRHWVILLLHGLLSLVLLVVPIIGALLVRSNLPALQDSSFYPFLVLGFWLYLMFVWVYFFIGWVDYYLDAWIVTNDRIINIEQNGLFNRVISEQRLYRVQDVTADVGGIIRTFFNFGTVHIQTAAEVGRFNFEEIPEPYQVKKIILELHEKALHAEYTRQATIEAMVANNPNEYGAAPREGYENPDMMTPGVPDPSHQKPASSGHARHPHELQ